MPSTVSCSTRSVWNLVKIVFFVHCAEYRTSHDASHQLLLPSPRCQRHHSLCLDYDVLHLPHLLSSHFFVSSFMSCLTWCMSNSMCSSSSHAAKRMARPRCHPSFSFAITTLSPFMFRLRIFRLLLLSLLHFRRLLLLLLRFPLSLVLSLLHFLLALRHHLWWRSFYFFTMISLYFFELRLRGFNVFSACSRSSCSMVSWLSCILDMNECSSQAW